MAAQNQGVAGEVPKAARSQLQPKASKGDSSGKALQLRLPLLAGVPLQTAGQHLLEKVKPRPWWVATCAAAEDCMDMIVVWDETQPRRQKLKENFHTMERAIVKQAFDDTGCCAWRFDPVAALHKMHTSVAQNAPAEDSFSTAGFLSAELVGSVVTEMSGLASWGDRDKDYGKRVQELLNRHVYGQEDLDTRILTDRFFQAGLLKRKGPVQFAAEMRERARRAELQGETLVSLCGAAAGAAEPLHRRQTSTVRPFNWLSLLLWLRLCTKCAVCSCAGRLAAASLTRATSCMTCCRRGRLSRCRGRTR
jgi:hypothetical protein